MCSSIQIKYMIWLQSHLLLKEGSYELILRRIRCISVNVMEEKLRRSAYGGGRHKKSTRKWRSLVHCPAWTFVACDPSSLIHSVTLPGPSLISSISGFSLCVYVCVCIRIHLSLLISPSHSCCSVVHNNTSPSNEVLFSPASQSLSVWYYCNKGWGWSSRVVGE